MLAGGGGAVVQYCTQLHRKPSRSFLNVYCRVHFRVTIKERRLGPYNKKLQRVALYIICYFTFYNIKKNMKYENRLFTINKNDFSQCVLTSKI